MSSSSLDEDNKLDELDEDGPPVVGANEAPKINMLRPYVYNRTTLQQLVADVKAGEIRLDTGYQRSDVWSTSAQKGLVDSLLGRVYFPPLLFSIHTDEDGTITRVCIDGKQRILALLRFAEGEIPYRERPSAEGTDSDIDNLAASRADATQDWYFSRKSGDTSNEKNKLYFSETKRQQVLQTTIFSMEYRGLKVEDELHIFAQTQNFKPLTSADKLRVIPSKYAAWIRNIRMKYFIQPFNQSASATSDTSLYPCMGKVSREQDFSLLTAIVHNLELSPDANFWTYVRHQCFSRIVGHNNEPEPGTKELVISVMDRFCQLTRFGNDGNINRVFISPTKLAPIEVLCIPFLLRRHKHLSNRRALEVVEKMRKFVAQSLVQHVQPNAKLVESVAEHLDQWVDETSPAAGETESAEEETPLQPALNINTERPKIIPSTDTTSPKSGTPLRGTVKADEEKVFHRQNIADPTTKPPTLDQPQPTDGNHDYQIQELPNSKQESKPQHNSVDQTRSFLPNPQDSTQPISEPPDGRLAKESNITAGEAEQTANNFGAIQKPSDTKEVQKASDTTEVQKAGNTTEVQKANDSNLSDGRQSKPANSGSSKVIKPPPQEEKSSRSLLERMKPKPNTETSVRRDSSPIDPQSGTLEASELPPEGSKHNNAHELSKETSTDKKDDTSLASRMKPPVPTPPSASSENRQDDKNARSSAPSHSLPSPSQAQIRGPRFSPRHPQYQNSREMIHERPLKGRLGPPLRPSPDRSPPSRSTERFSYSPERRSRSPPPYRGRPSISPRHRPPPRRLSRTPSYSPPPRRRLSPLPPLPPPYSQSRRRGTPPPPPPSSSRPRSPGLDRRRDYGRETPPPPLPRSSSGSFIRPPPRSPEQYHPRPGPYRNPLPPRDYNSRRPPPTSLSPMRHNPPRHAIPGNPRAQDPAVHPEFVSHQKYVHTSKRPRNY